MGRPVGILAILGAVSILPPYVGPVVGLELEGIDSIVEVVDHVIPGIIIFLAAGASFLLLRSGRLKEDSIVLASALAISLLAAVWQTSSHIPLILDGGRPEAPWGAVILHSTIGPIMTVLSLWLVFRALSVEPAEAERRAT
jgi:hypothetical protein